MPYLEIKLGPDTLLLRFVGRIDYVFGRLPRADVQVRDMKVSRLHTQFFMDSRGGAFVRDLGSSGGTWINNQQLRRGVIAPLTDGIKVRLGESRVTFYDSEPPVNAIEPPGISDPRGLIRTNARERYFEAEATVLAMNKVDPETQSGPSEPPPEVNPAQFADSAKDLEQKPKAPPAPRPSGPVAPPAARVPQKRPSGVLEAPWEKKESGILEPGKEKRITIPPPTRGGVKPSTRSGAASPPPPMATADIDELGNFKAPDAPAPEPAPPKRPLPLPPRVPQPAPLEELDETGRTSREPAVVESGAFQPPNPFHGELPDEEPEESAPRVGMPTVRLERPDLQARQKQIEQEEAEEAAALKIPTAAVKPDAAEVPDEPDPEPQIGVNPRSDTPVAKDDEEELTDEEIAVYLGGTLSGRYGDVDFGSNTPPPENDHDTNEVNFGSAAAKVSLEGDADIDLEDDPPEPASQEAPADPEEPAAAEPAAESVVDRVEAPAEESVEEAADEPIQESVEEPAEEPAEQEYIETNTSMLGGTTVVKAEPVDEQDAVSEDVPTYEENKTPPPATREGATEERTFKPRKTRKLMKRRKDTAKITDKKNATPLPEGAKTVHVPPPSMDMPIAMGAKTQFIPKPDDAKLSRGTADIDGGKSVESLGEGPGGDTVALPPDMLKQLQNELRAKEEPPTIGDNPTVKLPGEEEDEEEFVIDEDYAFFTPPPATRKAREAAARAAAGESDVINANDFHSETDNLPKDKKTASKDDPDTLVD